MTIQGNNQLETAQNEKFNVTKAQLENGVRRFENFFDSNIGGGGLITDSFLIEFANGLPEIFTLEGISNYPGLNFHYGLDISDQSICYILSYGDFDSNNNLISAPFTNSDGNPIYYKLSQRSIEHETIDQVDFNTLTTHYYNNVTKKNPSTGVFNPVGDYPNYNPKFVFHEKAELKAFYEEYKDLDNLHLYIYHGSNSALRHAVGLRFGTDRAPFPIDNVNYRLYGNSVRYRMKAFNIGQLCPPDCKKK